MKSFLPSKGQLVSAAFSDLHNLSTLQLIVQLTPVFLTALPLSLRSFWFPGFCFEPKLHIHNFPLPLLIGSDYRSWLRLWSILNVDFHSVNKGELLKLALSLTPYPYPRKGNVRAVLIRWKGILHQYIMTDQQKQNFFNCLKFICF
jgi:hypothetical protein